MSNLLKLIAGWWPVALVITAPLLVLAHQLITPGAVLPIAWVFIALVSLGGGILVTVLAMTRERKPEPLAPPVSLTPSRHRPKQ